MARKIDNLGGKKPSEPAFPLSIVDWDAGAPWANEWGTVEITYRNQGLRDDELDSWRSSAGLALDFDGSPPRR